MTTEQKYGTTWSAAIAQAGEGPPLPFLIMNKHTFGKNSQCYTDRVDVAATFMMGRQLCNYKLYVNDRLYGWGHGIQDSALIDIANHLVYWLDMDENFYPASEFPRGYWWE